MPRRLCRDSRSNEDGSHSRPSSCSELPGSPSCYRVKAAFILQDVSIENEMMEWDRLRVAGARLRRRLRSGPLLLVPLMMVVLLLLLLLLLLLVLMLHLVARL